MSDEERFEQLYSAHARAIASYLGARTDRQTAVDALARTFEIAWRRIADVPDEPKAWLFGVARRVLSDQRRSAVRGAEGGVRAPHFRGIDCHRDRRRRITGRRCAHPRRGRG